MVEAKVVGLLLLILLSLKLIYKGKLRRYLTLLTRNMIQKVIIIKGQTEILMMMKMKMAVHKKPNQKI